MGAAASGAPEDQLRAPIETLITDLATLSTPAVTPGQRATTFTRCRRDSGAIIVGAGQPSTRERLTFSSFGSRVDLQGWGSDVTTTGYGEAFNPGDIHQLYTFLFSGTSSASPIVAGAVLQIQGVLKNVTRSVTRPKALRAALVATGSPQGQQVPGHIGPLPNVVAALNCLKTKCV